MRHINGRPDVSGQTADAIQFPETIDAGFAPKVPRRSRAPHIALVVTSLGALAAAFFVVLGPLQCPFGFVPLPWPLVGAMAAVTAAYLATAEVAKHFALRQGA